MKKVMINSDDFGLTKGVNYGIIDCYKRGILTSTTLLTTIPSFHHAVELAKENPGLDIGIHMTLDIGRPVSEYSETLVNEDGIFKRYNLDENTVEFHQENVYHEWKAQIQKAIDHGIKPTHLDSHHHMHMQLALVDIAIRLAKEFNLVLRLHPYHYSDAEREALYAKCTDIKHVDLFGTGFYEDGATDQVLLDLFDRDFTTMEIMCHPGYIDQELLDRSSYTQDRVVEAAVLQDKKWEAILKEKGIELTTFDTLR